MLELDGLTRRFGDLLALDRLSFAVGEGEVFGFVGPNGAGKTTAMRIVLGVLAADAGEVRFGGRPVDEAARRRFGYMPEERGLYPKMTVGRQLTYFAAREKDQGHRCDLEAGMAKYFATEAAFENAHEAVRIHGGYGYSKEFAVERLYRDAPLLCIGEGTNEMQRLIIARQLIKRSA